MNKLDLLTLSKYGIHSTVEIIYNPTYNELFEEENSDNLQGYEKSIMTNSGALAIDTGIFTGRSPKDRYIVHDNNTKNIVWWNNKEKIVNDNHPMSQKTWNYLKNIVAETLSGKRLFVIDMLCGVNCNAKLKARFITEIAWQAHFVKNMFVYSDSSNLHHFKPDFVIMNGAKCVDPLWIKNGLNSENFIVFNFSERIQLIGGTWYNGEIKKGLFTIMNHILPFYGITPMHCSANISKSGSVTLFFGLSGTGKTTLSNDNEYLLIGDDEHGWDDNGIFNIESGCYAKVFNISPEKEPNIFRAIRRNALLENVFVNKDGSVDFSDCSKTENTRVSYPLNHLDNIIQPNLKVSHANTVIFLIADAFGVLPIASRLNLEQANYYFISGFTAKMGGTERGIIDPIPTFSSCFGAAFLTLHPMCYADLLIKRIKTYNTEVWLVNTGWNGTKTRFPLSQTRTIIDAIINGKFSKDMKLLPVFNLLVPKFSSNIDSNLLDPRYSWPSDTLWRECAKELARSFINNFEKLFGNRFSALSDFGPQL